MDVLGRVMLAFPGERLPDWVAARLAAAPAAGMTVFRHHNVRSPGQVRELTDAFQAAAAARGDAGRVRGGSAAPLLVAADQEGGQLQALGDAATAFPGNMALGAIGDPTLAERVGFAIGTEARAMGINVVYAPVMDLATNPDNAALGIRSFGDDPAAVSVLGSAMIRGLRSAGVAAAVKHFPGLGDAAADTHYGTAVVSADRERLERLELAPFRAGIAAGVDLVMSSHVAVPALTGDPRQPATLSRAVMSDLLRAELGFAGVTISDALDMGALAQDDAQRAQLAAAAVAGIDLFLCGADRAKVERIEAALVAAAADGSIPAASNAASLARIAALRSWLASQAARPGLEVVGGAEHRRLEAEVAARALTLVRDPAGRLPLRVDRDATIVAIMPTPTDLTPADTSSTIEPGLARALRTTGRRVDEVVVPADPTPADIAGARERVARPGVAVAIVGTLDARHVAGQADLVRAVAETGVPTVAVALRTPWDVEAYPASVTAVCTYSIHEASLDALVSALFGERGSGSAALWPGRLPVRIAAAPR